MNLTAAKREIAKKKGAKREPHNAVESKRVKNNFFFPSFFLSPQTIFSIFRKKKHKTSRFLLLFVLRTKGKREKKRVLFILFFKIAQSGHGGQ